MKQIAAHNAKNEASQGLGKQVLAGTMATATVNTGSRLLGKAVQHPLLVFGVGMIAGYFVYKYRKQIIAGATKTVNAGKNFVLQQKENLEDLVAEAKEDD